MILPNFLIVGVQKSGSSWLAGRLRQHPEAFLPRSELHFFDKDFNWERGVDWYARHFVEAVGAKAVGEKTPEYFWTGGAGAEGHVPTVHRNVHHVLPDARLIVVLREPVSRAVSAVRHIIRSGRLSPMHSLDELLLGRHRDLVAPHGVIEYGHYDVHLSAYRRLYPADRILVLTFEEDVVQAPEAGMRKVCRFLEIDADFGFEGLSRRSNENTASRLALVLAYRLGVPRRVLGRLDRLLPPARFSVEPSTLDALRAHYRPHNERLYEMLGRRIPAWEAHGGLPPGG